VTPKYSGRGRLCTRCLQAGRQPRRSRPGSPSARAGAADRYFGSFPKVGVVIPNAAAWLLPEFVDLGRALNMVVDMPTILPHGTRIDTTSDGFLLWLPSCAPPRARRAAPARLPAWASARPRLQPHWFAWELVSPLAAARACIACLALLACMTASSTWPDA